MRLVQLWCCLFVHKLSTTHILLPITLSFGSSQLAIKGPFAFERSCFPFSLNRSKSEPSSLVAIIVTQFAIRAVSLLSTKKRKENAYWAECLDARSRSPYDASLNPSLRVWTVARDSSAGSRFVDSVNQFGCLFSFLYCPSVEPISFYISVYLSCFSWSLGLQQPSFDLIESFVRSIRFVGIRSFSSRCARTRFLLPFNSLLSR